MERPKVCSYITVIIKVALLLTGSAILFFSCSSGVNTDSEDNFEGLMTQQSDSLKIISSENGRKSYRFETPLMERYEFAKEPYMEFRKGINVVTYDSVGNVESTLVADYAINFENQKLWEAKGNVVATNSKGEILETQQLFWNQKTHRVYSNIDSKITRGEDVTYVVGFESDEEFSEWELRHGRGRIWVNAEPNRDTANVERRPASDSVTGPAPAADNRPPASRPVESTAADRPQARREVGELADEKVAQPLKLD